MDETISLVLFSGTDDKLQAAATLAAGAAALGRPVKIFLQFWALDAFRADLINADHGLAAEAGEAGKAAVAAAEKAGQARWPETLRAAKELGEVDIQACSASMAMLKLGQSDLDHGLAPEAGPAGRIAVDSLRAAGQASWAETLRQAKDLGGVDIEACSLSMDLLHLEESDLDPLVNGVEGVTAFWLAAGDGPVVFI